MDGSRSHWLDELKAKYVCFIEQKRELWVHKFKLQIQQHTHTQWLNDLFNINSGVTLHYTAGQNMASQLN